MKSVETRKAELEARRGVLLSRIEEIGQELDAHDSKDWEELAVEREADEVLEDLGLSAQHELRMIEAALKRVDEGEYGYCVKCGSQIAEERLEVLPATPFCKDCAPRR
ncbi:TraR/DksA family transcriptional regulator [Albidovulum sp.]|uniref:TraR/DksA family transcriptional regulator n=1 Tax=Albidovulum sp. TaxID=1872424 RepID=UPI001D2543D0|nr:TraR/DksA family transcriptional regulator [Paracoccaceae bacterium]HPE24640.1 TraR/DksA C4-type zinc finger protein [Albidovulum sp.]MCB2119790.1 TraR/DksA family transcriptional regulator [Paracoccaceae bacterium]MCB2123627.1 TraR/DksA family transcriptional regulator [Paracoccaceae bacterium]MCB2131591.1 TraR/DksA family transcriptional regulator [Paracoccaceae bacterium]